MSKLKSTIIKLFTLLFVACSAFAIATMPKVSAQEIADFSVTQGASIRNGESDGLVGLKFSSSVNETWLSENQADNYTFGTLLYPTAKEVSFDESLSATENMNLVDAMNIIHVQKQAVSESQTFNASIIFDRQTVVETIEAKGLVASDELVESVLRNLYNKDFTARAYAVVNGETIYTNSYSTSMYKVASRTYAFGDAEDNESYKTLALNYFESASVKTASINFYDGILDLGDFTASENTIILRDNAKLEKDEDYTIDENGNILFDIDYANLGNQETLFVINNGVLVVANATYGGDVKSVSNVLNEEVNSEVVIRGYYVGVSNLDVNARTTDGVYTKTQLLIKDTASDDIIGVRKEFATFGSSSWTYTKQYTYGDEVIIKGTVLADDVTINQNYIEFGENNPANAETIISKNNIVNYAFEDATVLDEWSDWTEAFNSSTLKPMTLFRISGHLYTQRHAYGKQVGSETSTTARNGNKSTTIHMNASATKNTHAQISSRYVYLIDNVMNANLGSSSKYATIIPRGNASCSANWGTYPAEGDVDLYVLYTGATASQYELVVLQEWWLTAHDHVYDGGEEIATCTVEGCNYKHVHSFNGEWQTESLSTVVTKGVKYKACDTYGCTKKEYGEIELATAVSIAVTQNPDNIYYNPGDKFDPKGMVVTATADNGTTCDITKFVTIEDKTLSYEDYTLTISYEGLTTTISLNMVEVHDHTYEGEWLVDYPATITKLGQEYRVCTFEGCTKRETKETPKVEVLSIEITQMPDKVDYFVYESFDKSGLEVTAYGANDYSEVITDYVTVEEKILALGENVITVTYGDFTKTITVNAQPNSVSEVSYDVLEDAEVMVEGYFVGVANEGDSADKEMLIKDVDTDDIIAIRGVSYDTFANNFGYTYGDLVRISATLKVETDVQTLGKKYLDFSNKNGDKASTIISSGNAVNFSLENTLDLFEPNSMSSAYWVNDTLNKTSNFYKIIKLKGCVFGFRYGSTDDIVIHNNTEFTNTVISKFTTNGKYITFRNDANSQNVGGNWIEYFGGDLVYSNSSSKAIGPGYAVLVDMYAVYTGGDANTYQLTILSSDWLNSTDTVVDGDYDNVEVMKEVILAYYRQAGQFQYNQTIQRRNINASPEDATAQRQLYVDCSSFANAVFYEAFGLNIIQDGVPIVKDGVTYDSLSPQTYNTQVYCEQYLGQDPAVLAVWKKSTDYNTTAKKKELIEYVLANLQPGDVFNYRYGDGSTSRGHIIIYLGNDTFFHSRGGDFSNIGEDGVETPGQTSDLAWHYERCSTISFLNKTRVLNEGGDRYLFDKGVICWIRPLARENVTPTQNSLARMQYQGLETEKTVDKGINSSVNKGDTITYTIKVTNHSRTDYKEIEVKEILGENVTLTQAPSGYVLDGNTLTFNFDINHFSTVEFSYTVKVKDTAETGAIIESEQTTVGGILTTRVFNVVSGYTSAQLNSIVTKAKGFASSGTSFDNHMRLIKDLYADLGVTAFDDYDSVSSLLSELLDYDADVLVDDCAIAPMVAPDLYGGRFMSNLYINDKDNVRLIKENNLSIGDIIIADYLTAQKDEGGNNVVDDNGRTVYDTTYYVVYVYVGNGQLVALSNEPAVTSKLDTCVLKTMNESQYSSDNVLVTLYSYSRYAVIRPSMVA